MDKSQAVHISVNIQQRAKHISTNIFFDAELNKSLIKNIRITIRRILSLYFNTVELLNRAKSIGSEYEKLVKKGAGKLLTSSTLWEDAVKTLFTTNCAWSLTKKDCQIVCIKLFSKLTFLGEYPFPGPNVFKNYSIEKIRESIPVGYRGSYFKESYNIFKNSPSRYNFEKRCLKYDEASNKIKCLKGFGPYAIRHLMILNGY